MKTVADKRTKTGRMCQIDKKKKRSEPRERERDGMIVLSSFLVLSILPSHLIPAHPSNLWPVL